MQPARPTGGVEAMVASAHKEGVAELQFSDALLMPVVSGGPDTLRRSGQLNTISIVGRANRYRLEDLDRLIRDRIVRPRFR